KRVRVASPLAGAFNAPRQGLDLDAERLNCLARQRFGELAPDIAKIAAERGDDLVQAGRTQRFDLRRDTTQLFLKLRKFRPLFGLCCLGHELRRGRGRGQIRLMASAESWRGSGPGLVGR